MDPVGIILSIYDSFSSNYWISIELKPHSKIWFDSYSDSVYYFRLATESDDSVAKSVGLKFYGFNNKIPL